MEKLEKFSKKFRELKKNQKSYLDLCFKNKSLDKKSLDKLNKLKSKVADHVKTLFINQSRIDEIVEELSECSKRVKILEIKLISNAKKWGTGPHMGSFKGLEATGRWPTHESARGNFTLPVKSTEFTLHAGTSVGSLNEPSVTQLKLINFLNPWAVRTWAP